MQPTLGKFQVLRRLGEGAMGEVFLGRDTLLGREVALKTIRASIAVSQEVRERFKHEAQAAGSLSHPNLVTVHEFGEDQGTLYLAMEYVPGDDLQVLLRDGGLQPDEALEVLAQVCDGLGYAHAKGILHRDIKPSNVRVTRELGRLHAKVMDFGIARLAGSDLTDSGTLLGTFGYMAPEYIQSAKPDPRSDLFSVGVMLYEALAGRRPFQGDTTATLLYRIVNEAPQPLPPTRLRGVSPQIQGVLRKALAKVPGLRFQTGAELAAVLRAAKDPAWAGLQGAEHLATLASPKTLLAPPPPPARTNWTPLIAASALALAGGVWALRPSRTPQPVAHPVVEPPPPATHSTSHPPSTPPIQRPAIQEAEPPRGEIHRPPPREDSPPPIREEPRPRPQEEAYSPAEAPRPQFGEGAEAAHRNLSALRVREPDNPMPYALDAVALYSLGRYSEMAELLTLAQRRGLEPQTFPHRFPRFRAMLQEEHLERRLPSGMERQLREILGEGPQGRRRR